MIFYWLLALFLAAVIAKFYDSFKKAPEQRLRGRRLLDSQELKALLKEEQSVFEEMPEIRAEDPE